MLTRLSEKEYQDAANVLGCEVAVLKCVAEVESSNAGGFDKSGRLLLRFEGHHFRRYTRKAFDRTHPDVSYPYSLMGHRRHGYDAFNLAFALDPYAAMMSTSWGAFQIMGFNHDTVGFEKVEEMVDYLRVSEANQLNVFVKTVQAFGLTTAFRFKNWFRIAVGYNGEGQAANNYAPRLERAYTKYHRGRKLLAFVTEQTEEPEASTDSDATTAAVSAIGEGVVILTDTSTNDVTVGKAGSSVSSDLPTDTIHLKDLKLFVWIKAAWAKLTLMVAAVLKVIYDYSGFSGTKLLLVTTLALVVIAALVYVHYIKRGKRCLLLQNK